MIKYKLLYEDIVQNRLDCLGEFNTEKEAMAEMCKYMPRKPDYYRFWKENDATVIDFGSHTKFFKIQEIER